MNKNSTTWRSNISCAHRIWGQLPATAISTLKQLTNNLAVSVAAGDLQFLENRWYVTHSGLLRIAQRRKCRGIETAIQDQLSDPQNNKWVVKATVFKSKNYKGFFENCRNIETCQAEIAVTTVGTPEETLVSNPRTVFLSSLPILLAQSTARERAQQRGQPI